MRKQFCFTLILLCLVLFFTGCGKASETPEEAVTNALNAIKSIDRPTMTKYFGAENVMTEEADVADDGKIIRDVMYRSLEFRILSSEAKGDTAVVKTELSNTDAVIVRDLFMELASNDLLDSMFSEDLSDEEMLKIIDEAIAEILKSSTVRRTFTVEHKLLKVDGGWVIEFDDSLRNAILGGLLEDGN